jgi:hypothetical protein
MILPDGYSDVPAGKIAAVVTHLEMTARSSRRDDPLGAWSLRKVDAPALDWYRDLHRRVGEEWLWFSRARMSDAELATVIHAPGIEVYAWSWTAAMKACWSWTFARPASASWSISASPHH